MRRKKFVSKLLSVMLSAAVIVTSSFGGLTLVDVDATEVATEETVVVSDNSADTQQEPATEETVVTDEAADDNAAEKVADEPETKTEDVSDTSEDSKKGAVSEDIGVEKAIDENTTVAELVASSKMDVNIAQVLLYVYNEAYNDGDDVAFDAFALGNVWGINGEIDFDEVVAGAGLTLESITSAKGLGYAKNATGFDLGQTAVLVIADSEFESNTSVESIVLPDALQGIGDNAFKGCKNLEHINVYTEEGLVSDTLPSSLVDRQTKSNIFNNCDSLTSITIPNFKNPSALQLSTSHFANCDGLTEVVISASVSIIPKQMFYASGNPTSGMAVEVKVTGEEEALLEIVEEDAFQCAEVSGVDLSACKKLRSIGARSFAAALVTSNSSEANKATVSLSTFVLPETITSAGLTIGDEAFFKTNLATMSAGEASQVEGTVAIPDYVTKVGKGCFYANKAVRNLVISANLEKIEPFAFYSCEYVENVTQSVDENGDCKVTSIGDMAFYQLGNKLTDDITLNADFLRNMNHLTAIGETNFDIAEGKEDDKPDVEEYSYYNYEAQKKSSQIYGSHVFLRSKIRSAAFPASLRTIASCAFDNAILLQSVSWESDPMLAANQQFVIGTQAFANCVLLEEFVYPRTSERKASFVIKPRCFVYDILLEKFSEEGTVNGNGSANAMPATLTELGGASFMGCMSLETMLIKNNETGVSPKIGPFTFLWCYNLAEAELPSGLEIIPQHMFYDCALTEMPSFEDDVNSVQVIGAAAFFGNRMQTLDLSEFIYLKQIGASAFACIDTQTVETIRTDQQTQAYIISDELEDSDYQTSPLKKVVFPEVLVGTTSLELGNCVFYGAKSLTTVGVPGHMYEGAVLIPMYITDSSCGTSVFADTGITDVVWAYTLADDGGSHKWTTIPKGMFAQTKITDLSKACLPAEDLVMIDSYAYSETLIEELDLSPYVNLETTKSSSFANCWNLAKVIFPINGKYKKINARTFQIGYDKNAEGTGLLNLKERKKYDDELEEKIKSSLTEIDFGGVENIGKRAFACIDEEDKEKYPSSLQMLDFTETNVTLIDENAFAAHVALEKLNLEGVTELGIGCFRLCTSLNLTDAPIADSVTKIGKQAFYKDSSIGEVTFGAGIKSIGEQAFAECAVFDTDEATMDENPGLTLIDFSKATSLTTIGANAFYRTAIKDFDITNTKVKQLQEGAISDCPYLQNVTLNQGLQKINTNAVYGCIALSRFEFWSTTTIVKTAFQKKGSFKNGTDYSTPVKTLSFIVKPVELNLGLGTEMAFPYYVSSTEVSDGEFGKITIGSENNEDDNIHRYVKVLANTTGYYRNDSTKEINKIADSRYFEKTGSYRYNVNGTDVYTFRLIGLEKTPEGADIPFTITNEYEFSSDQYGTLNCTMTLTYNLVVKDIAYYPVLYTDADRKELLSDMQINKETGMTVGASTIRPTAADQIGYKTVYYDIENIIETNWQPPNGNLIVKVDKPEVLIMSTKFTEHVDKVNANTWKVTAEYTNATGVDVTKATSGKNLIFKPKSSGDAVVTIYPENYPSKTITWKVHVTSDISAISLSAPTEAKEGVQLNQKFSVLSKVTMYMEQYVSRKEGTLGNLAKYTDNKIVFTSSNPSVASVDANGVVTIHKVSTKEVPVTFKAVATLSDGSSLVKEFTYNVVYPELASGKEVTDHTGTTVLVTSTGKNPTVTYVKAPSSATSVEIPATMTVNGVTCKVTEVAANAFANNKVLTSVTIPKNVTKIGKKAFYNCASLTKVTFKSGSKLKEIGTAAFQGCKALKKITISSKYLKKIGSKAFYNCSKLKKITVKSKKVTSVGKNAFKGIHKKAVIDVPNSKKGTYKKLFKKGQGKKVKIK